MVSSVGKQDYGGVTGTNILVVTGLTPSTLPSGTNAAQGRVKPRLTTRPVDLASVFQNRYFS
jgi:hypothetical protein